MFTFLDENESWHLNENIDRYCTKPRNKVLLKDEKNFQESNKMHGVNGFVLANADGVKMYQKEKWTGNYLIWVTRLTCEQSISTAKHFFVRVTVKNSKITIIPWSKGDRNQLYTCLNKVLTWLIKVNLMFTATDENQNHNNVAV